MTKTRHAYFESAAVLTLLIYNLTIPATPVALDANEESVATTEYVDVQLETPEVKEESTQPIDITEPTSSVEEYIIIERLIEPSKVPTQDETIDGYIDDICVQYGIDPYIVRSIVWYESRYQPDVSNGSCIGLMQVSKRWHVDRAERLGVTDFYDPYSNILLGVDYLAELYDRYKDEALALMLYSMDNNTAFTLHKSGQVSNYVKLIWERSESLKQEVT